MLTTIRIRNLKALNDTKECRVGKMTLLTGINGRGKSSFLQAILLLSQSMRLNGGSPKLLYPTGDWCSLEQFHDILSFDAKSPLQIDLTTNEKKENIFEFQYQQSIDSKLIGEACSIKIDGVETISVSAGTPGATGDPKNQVASGNKVPGNNVDREINRNSYEDIAFLSLIENLFFVSADRYAAQNSETIVKQQRNNYLGEHGQYVLNVLNQCTPEQRHELEKEMGEILGGATLEIESDEANNRIYLYLDAETNGRKFKPINVGYGYSYIISTILSAILVPQNGILIIENPEAHLHPQAQSRLIKYLVRVAKEKNIQCFIETHSDHIVNGLLISLKERKILVDDAQILFFDKKIRDEQSYIDVSNLELTQYGRVRRPPKGFCDQYAIDLRNLI